MNAACAGAMEIAGMPAFAAAALRSRRNASSCVVRFARYWKCASVTRIDSSDMAGRVTEWIPRESVGHVPYSSTECRDRELAAAERGPPEHGTAA